MRLHLIDGTYELFRAHFSKRPDHRTPGGQDAKATVGLVSSLLTLLDDPAERVTHLAVAFDNPIVCFRNELFAGYKTDEGIPPELRSQFDLVEEAVRATGVVVWSMDRWEADDAIATGARRWRDRVEQVRILSPDKDLGQSIRGQQVVQVDRMRNRVFDEEMQVSLRSVRPQSVPDFLALVGDTADGIPGLPGFGEKSTAAILAEYPKLEDIPDDVRAWRVKPRGAEKLAATLAAARREALLYRTLATLIEDVPLQEELEELEWRGAPRARFDAWCSAIGADYLKTKPARWQG